MASGRNRPGKSSGTATRSRPGTGGGKTTGNGGGKAAGNGGGKEMAKRPAATVSKPASRSVPQNRKARDRARAKELASQQVEAEPAAVGPARWVQFTSFALAIIGLGISVYLTIEHFTGNSSLACSGRGLVDCARVTTSPESMVFGVFPVAVLGLAFYVFMVPATTPWAWRSRRREIALARLASVIVGVGFILYLIYVELIQVGAICLWCTGVHVATFLLFVLVALSAAVWGLHPGDAANRAQ
ncbi:MAG TPA: vitamin K epoxide reductase family protein [Streptosporangiaceae bacterium]